MTVSTISQQSTLVDVTQCGVVPTPASVDVMNTANAADFIDNGPALMALRDKLIAIDRFRHWTLFFPATDGAYQYSINRWLMGLVNVKVSAYGAKIQCIWNGPFNVGDVPWFSEVDGVFVTNGDASVAGGMGRETGDLIESTVIGDFQITLSNAADATKYSVGQRVLLHSFCQQIAGYSLNARYFEWCKIKAVNGAVLEMASPIRNEHRSDFTDHVVQQTVAWGMKRQAMLGRARILTLDDREVQTSENYWCHEDIQVQGGNWIINPHFQMDGQPQGFVLSGRKVQLDDMQLDEAQSRVWPREAEYYAMRNVHTDGNIEPDKIIDTLVLDQCSADGNDSLHSSLRAATGVNTLILRGFQSASRINVSPKRLISEGGFASSVSRDKATGTRLPNDVGFAPLMGYGGVWGCYGMYLTGLDTRKDKNQSDFTTWFNADPLYRKHVVQEVQGNSIFIPRINQGTSAEVLPVAVTSLLPGSELVSYGDKVIGTVERIISDSTETKFEIQINLTGLMPIKGAQIKWKPVHEVVINGKELNG